MKKFSLLIVLLFLGAGFAGCIGGDNGEEEGAAGVSPEEMDALLSSASERNPFDGAVLLSPNQPILGLVAAPAACWYDSEGMHKLPLIVADTQEESKFLAKTGATEVAMLGFTTKPCCESREFATRFFKSADTVLMVRESDYALGISGAPLASYLNLPLLVVDEEERCGAMAEALDSLGVKNIIALGGNAAVSAAAYGYEVIVLETRDEMEDALLGVVSEKLGGVDYIAMTNPYDALDSPPLSSETNSFEAEITNVQLIAAGERFSAYGEPFATFDFQVAGGINHIRADAIVTETTAPYAEGGVEPIIGLALYDPAGVYLGFGSSAGFEVGSTYVETLAIGHPGTYKAEVYAHFGTKGLSPVVAPSSGVSAVSMKVRVDVCVEEQESPKMALSPNLSMIAPYLAAARGGTLLAGDFGFIGDAYANASAGNAAMPGYNKNLHGFVNAKVGENIGAIEEYLDRMEVCGLKEGYLAGPAWLSLVGGANSIPMYYYPTESEPWPEDGVGLPADLPYSTLDPLDEDGNIILSIGRMAAPSIDDLSELAARSLFYDDYRSAYETSAPLWGSRFLFLFGEGFAEMGGVFHQVPYAAEVAQHGFYPLVVGDEANGRTASEAAGYYTGSNYIEIIVHGNWFIYAPVIYGPDAYSQQIDTAHVNGWDLGPSVFITSACHTGRTDSVPADQALSLAFIRAGVNCYIGATRGTGSESQTQVFEDALIKDDLSVGEAFRLLKQEQIAPPSYQIRTLYGDPAFNPYEPNNV
ncbi:MAG: hypothetical protein CVT48_05310 [Thermoplasmata archaeon HGW-Thermoplasmata-1]|nr:MAG: hypothetical protein CVT48_05310 [Thermoplasmata archaeon HGW-Thermoplasmata-1]